MAKIRLAEKPDCATLAPVFGAFFHEDGITVDTGTIEANLKLMMATPTARIWVAEDDGALVGLSSATMTIGVEFGRAVEIEDLYVVPSHRGQGLSHRLLRPCMEWAKEIQASEVFLVIAPEAQADQDLVAFYEKLGFNRSGRIVMFQENGDSASP